MRACRLHSLRRYEEMHHPWRKDWCIFVGLIRAYSKEQSVLGGIAFLTLQICEFAIWIFTVLFSPQFSVFLTLAISAYVVFFAYTQTGFVVDLIKEFPDKAYEHVVGKYCEYVRIGCRSSLPTKNLGGITSNIANQVVGANDIFDMITAMGDHTRVSLGNRGEHKGYFFVSHVFANYLKLLGAGGSH